MSDKQFLINHYTNYQAKAECYYNIGESSLKEGNVDHAKSWFSEALKYYEKCYEISRLLDYDKACLALENMKNCLEQLQVIEFKKTKKKSSDLEK